MSLPLFRLSVAVVPALLLLLASSGPGLAQEEAAAPPAAEAETAPAENGDDAENAEETEPTNPGQADLDEAMKLKLTAEDGRQLSRVIELLNSAIDKGLDDDNRSFAEEMLTASLMQRAAALSQLVLDRPLPDPAQDPRWLQIRDIALKDLARVVEIDPQQFEAQILMGRLQQLPQGDSEAATKAFSAVIDAEEAPAELQAEAAARRAVTQEGAAQLADLTTAVELAPESIEYRLLRARHHFAEENYEASLADVDHVLTLASDNYATHELRALVLLALDRQEEALASFDRATELAPDAVTPYLRRSELFGQLGNLGKAIEQATKAIELQPDSPLGYLVRADLHLQNDEPDAALRDVDRALRLRPGLVQALLLKARAFDVQGRTREALGQLEELAEALPPQMELNLQIAIYALQLEMPRRAIAALDRAHEVEPDNALVLRFRADARLNIGQHKEAIADYEQALAIEPDDTGVLNNLAWTLATSPDDELRDAERAIELATKANELTEYKLAHMLSTLAAAYAETGDFEKAKEWAQKAVEFDDEQNAEQIADELASYQRGEPWRERQQLDAGEREGATPQSEQVEPDQPIESTPAPGRTIDF